MATKTFTVSKQYMAELGGPANPGDLHIPIGRWDPGTGLAWTTRALLYAPVSFSGMTSINSARLYLYQHTAAGWHANGSGTKGLWPFRKTADWNETSGGVSSSVDEIWGGDGDAYVESNYVDAGDGSSDFNTDAADGTLDFCDITEIVKDWFAGSPNYGVMIRASSGAETTDSTDAMEFYSRHVSGKKPYIWIDYNTNTAPNAPTSLSPTGSVVRHTGTSFTASGVRSDPDSGDYITAYQIVVYKDDGVTAVADSGGVATSGTPTSFSRTMSVGSHGANKFYRWKARTRDKANVWGPYSAQQRVKLNTVPNVPVINAVPTNDLSPIISGSASDPDSGDGMTHVQLEVLRSSDNAVMWTSGDRADTGTSWSQTYAGSALAWSTSYKVRARIKDANGAYSSWSAYKTWTTSQPVGPTLSPRNPGIKTNDTTPDLTISYSENFTDHEIYLYSNSGGTTLVFSSLPAAYTATSSKVVTVSPALQNGVTYYWKARVFIASTGQWSQWAGFVSGQSGTLSAQLYINALPTAPTELVARNDADTQPTQRDSDGVYIVTTLTPLLEFKFNDPDEGPYGDVASNGDIEVYNNGTGALHWSATNQTGLNDGALTYAGTALVFETTYKFRVRFKDDSGSYGSWSAYTLFKPTQLSTVTSVTPTGTIDNPRITIGWDHVSPGGKAQGKYHVAIFDKGPTGVPSYQEAVMNLAPSVYIRMGGDPLVNLGSMSVGTITPTNGPVLQSPGLLTRDEDTAVLFDGTDDWVSVPTVPAISVPFTIAGWCATNTDKAEYIVARGSNGYLRRSTTGVTFSWLDGGSIQRSISGPDGLIPEDGSVHFVVGTHDGTWARLYVDGVEVASSNGWTALATIATGTWGIGSNNTGTADWWEGTVDEIAIWSGVALDATQIMDLYLSGTDPQNYPSPVQVYDSGVVVSSVESHDAPTGFLVNNHDYRVDVESFDTDGV